MKKRKENLIKFLTALQEISEDGWVYGYEHSIVSVMKSADLPLNTPLTTGLIDDLKNMGVIHIDNLSKRDYMYAWNWELNMDIPEIADRILKMRGLDLELYSVGDPLYLMYDNAIQSAKVVEVLSDSIVIVFTTAKGTKSLVINPDAMMKYSVGSTKETVIEKITNKVPYEDRNRNT
jgi:hypothetical protein